MVNAIYGMTAVAAATTGNDSANLFTVLRVAPKSLKDSYTGTLFYEIFGRKIWSLAIVTLGS